MYSRLVTVDIPDFCTANPKSILPDPDNCAHFYNCSEKMSPLVSYKHECQYPDLFSTKTRRCENFTTVQCDKRKEPMAPCKLYAVMNLRKSLC